MPLDAVAGAEQRQSRSLSEGVLVPLEKGGYLWCRRDRLPDAELTLEAELAFRKRLIEEDDRESLRRSWNLSAPAQPETICDVLVQVVRNVREGRAPRSTRRVVRGNSSRGDPDSSDPPDVSPGNWLARGSLRMRAHELRRFGVWRAAA